MEGGGGSSHGLFPFLIVVVISKKTKAFVVFVIGIDEILVKTTLMNDMNHGVGSPPVGAAADTLLNHSHERALRDKTLDSRPLAETDGGADCWVAKVVAGVGDGLATTLEEAFRIDSGG